MLSSDEANDNCHQLKKRTSIPRHHRRERHLWHRAEEPSELLGCQNCADKEMCGGLRLSKPLFDCLAFCCGGQKGCDRVCPRRPKQFVERCHEVGTLDLSTVLRAQRFEVPPLAPVVPLIYHGSRRERQLDDGMVALPLACVFDARTGLPLFDDGNHLRSKFKLGDRARIILSGTDEDPAIENWWGIERAKRYSIIRKLRSAGVELITTPNYSLFSNRPRWDDLHAMKRIAIVHEEFLSAGMPSALHVNGRTERDFERWAEYVEARPEVTHIAYEFTTGTGWKQRRHQHAVWLCDLAKRVSRPLSLVVRGGTSQLAVLRTHFSDVTLIETSIFLRTMNRRRAITTRNAQLSWEQVVTQRGAALDDLLEHNRRIVTDWYSPPFSAIGQAIAE